MATSTTPETREIATLGGGCFWCLEAVFEHLNGVSSVVSGYTGGQVECPTYEEVCGKRTGHAEVIQITFDPSIVTFRTVLEVFFATHDPTTLNRQGNDVGPQYRSAIFVNSEEQCRIAEELIAGLTADKVFANPIVTEIAPLTTFYPAEGYHQGYYRENPEQPYCAFVVAPKLAKFRKQFAQQYRA